MKPCPWCGTNDISLESYKEATEKGYVWFASAECGYCNAQGPLTGDPDRLEAIAKAEQLWNTPKPTPPQIQLIREDQDPRGPNRLADIIFLYIPAGILALILAIKIIATML